MTKTTHSTSSVLFPTCFESRTKLLVDNMTHFKRAICIQLQRRYAFLTTTFVCCYIHLRTHHNTISNENKHPPWSMGKKKPVLMWLTHLFLARSCTNLGLEVLVLNCTLCLKVKVKLGLSVIMVKSRGMPVQF